MELENIPNGKNTEAVAVEKLLQVQYNGAAHEKPKFWFSKRFLVMILLFIGNFNVVILKVNINIAVVEMTSEKNITEDNKNITIPPEFNWNKTTIGVVQSVFAYGYLLCLIGSYLVRKFGGCVTYGTSIMLASAVTILTPACLQIHFYLFVLARVLVGIFDGFAYTSGAEVLLRWAPLPERSTIMSLCFCGIYIGIAVSYPICGIIATTFGWRMIFYTTGIETLIWSFIWLTLVRNQPSKDKRMSRKELLYILENTETTSRKEVVYPYAKIIFSIPVWALCVAKFTYSWGFTLLVASLPLYVADMTNLSTDQVGMIASIPNFACIFMVPLAGTIMDFWQNNSSLTPNQIHKIMMSVGFISGSVGFLVASCSVNFILSMICFVFTKLMLSFNYLILQMVGLYMSPKHASIVAGFSAFWYTLSSICIPNVVGILVPHKKVEEWNRCFLISAGVLFVGAAVFSIYGSSDPQPWSTPTKGDTCANVNGKHKIENITAFED